ncbi:MAG: alanyl-tRNA editing protein [Bacteroidetes bacterium]|nr:MAG: alanyl-tRNA editing protein [Bacteroidota bacterium]
MTTFLYQTDSYLRAFESEVLATHPDLGGLLLNQTAFYPGGGGQPHDLGVLRHEGGELKLKGFRREAGKLWHLVEGPLPPTGTRLYCELDWERRYQLMRTHTAMHILCGVIWRDYQALVTGGDMQPLAGRMDFEFEHMSRELVSEIETNINIEVQAARPIRVAFLSREEADRTPDLIRTKINLLPKHLTEIRTVEIVGLDLQADGGTHVANTREVGRIRIVDYKSKGRLNKRVKMALE